MTTVYDVRQDAPDAAEELRRSASGLPWCDICKAPAVWSEFHGWLHSTAERQFGLYEHEDPVDHRPLASEWWNTGSYEGPGDAPAQKEARRP